ncbi:TPA: hypothetical protein HA239_04090 [Candidatus Woesearchaeota archaeon]|nr:hypothetical protein QT06_C0001G0764 [archaeon GW2011_AR15]MBS3103455.1 hypothetical protein [Candidatus Woesearchaeota archaeon]HIH41573.1 hypothetical protein [Candidatus Woesearchaeota archaeon]
MRKAQSISINTIVVAAIALIVLVVLIAIFGGRIRNFGEDSRSCQSQGGVGCFESCDSDTLVAAGNQPGIYTNLPGTDCEDQGENDKCCVLVVPTGG